MAASFDGGAITTDAGALLRGQTDRAIRLTERFAACFTDIRTAGLVDHQIDTLVMRRVIGIALAYEDLNDYDELRHDLALPVLASKLAGQRSDCAPLAGKSTLNRLQLSHAEATRYDKISLAWRGANQVYNILGLARNDRLGLPRSRRSMAASSRVGWYIADHEWYLLRGPNVYCQATRRYEKCGLPRRRPEPPGRCQSTQ